MPHLYTWREPPHYRIYGPEAGESGPWYCTCENGRRHEGPRDPITHEKPALCRHLNELFNVAGEGDLSGRFTETAAGEAKTDCGCACNDGEPLRRLPPPQPPPQPIPGQPSKNRPCPCGGPPDRSGLIYKRCHGSPEGPPPGAPPWPPREEPARPPTEGVGGPGKRAKKPERTPAELVEHRLELARARAVRRAEERAKEKRATRARKGRVDQAIANAHAADEARRETRRKRDAARRAKK